MTPLGMRLARLRPAWWLPAVLPLVAAGIAATTVRMVAQCAVPVPVLDQWAQLVGSRTVTLSWLLSLHNEHRLLFPRLVFVADRWLFAETGTLSLAVSVLMQAGLALLLILSGRAAGVRPRDLTLCGSAVVGLLFWAVQYENYTWPFQVQFFGVLLAAAACFAAVARARPTLGGAALVIGLGLVAVLTLSSGIVVLPLAAGLAAALRRPPLYVAGVALAGLAVLGLYLIGYQVPPEHTDPVQALMHPAAVLGYAAAVLGGPFANALGMLTGHVDPWLAELTGAAGVGLLGLACLSLFRRGQPAPQAAALLALCGFVLATALLTAMGRLGLGLPSALASRYATPVLAFWACLLLLGMARPRSPVWAGLAAGLLLLVVTTQPSFTRVARQVAADRAIAMPALVAGVADQKLIAPVYATPAVPLQVRMTQLATRTGPFSQSWASWIGTKLQDHAAITSDARCEGRFSSATPIEDPGHPGWRVQGEMLRPSQARHRQIIALAAPGGQIAGFGITDADSTTLVAGGPAGDPPRTGWVGAIAGATPNQVQAYVLLDHDTAACPLQNAPQMEAALQLGLVGPAPETASPAGSVDTVTLQQHVTMDGWALVQRQTGTPRLELDTNLPVQSATIVPVARPDAAAAYNDPRLAKSGFRVVLILQPGKPMPAEPRLCAWSEDDLYGVHRLIMNDATEEQRELCPS